MKRACTLNTHKNEILHASSIRQLKNKLFTDENKIHDC